MNDDRTEFIAMLKFKWSACDGHRLDDLVVSGQVSEEEAAEIRRIWKWKQEEAEEIEPLRERYRETKTQQAASQRLTRDNSTFGERTAKAGKEFAKNYPKALFYRFLGLGIFIALLYFFTGCGS